MAKKQVIKVAFAAEAQWGFIPTDKARKIITALQKITQRSKTSLLNEACEKMEKG